MSVDELRNLGLEAMDEGDVQSFLDNQGVGVLGLPATDGPYLIPMSFAYDGADDLYFTYVLGQSSRKQALSDRAETAQFLVYDVTSPFVWQSVLLSGSISELPEEEWDRMSDLDNAWHPDLLESATLSRGVSIYRFRIRDREGFKHTGLPPGFQRERSGREE
jgi:nitroimidazol reductase NimA-like FMN-containing flavoprotein (pyridoxamine 5'-phosphate oxidase superfamily)